MRSAIARLLRADMWESSVSYYRTIGSCSP